MLFFNYITLKFVCLVGFLVVLRHTRELFTHIYEDFTITVKGFWKLNYTRHSPPLSSEGSWTGNTYCDTGNFLYWSFSRTRDTGARTCCRALDSGAATTCFDDLGLIEPESPACETNALLLSQPDGPSKEFHSWEDVELYDKLIDLNYDKKVCKYWYLHLYYFKTK